MKRLFLVAAITSLVATMALISWAATTINTSKSNSFKIIYSTDGGMTSTQAAALGTELDKTPRADEAAVRKALQKLSIPANFKLIRIIPRQAPGKLPTVLLLTNPKDEAEATRIAINDPGMPAGKRVAPSIPPASSK
jgi:hypothetical protein